MKNALKIALLESTKEHESRIPIHPQHFKEIPCGLNQVVFQENYAKNFSETNSLIKKLNFSFETREKLLSTADIIFLLKPETKDLAKMKIGAILIGWCHAVQRIEIADIAEERGLTLIAMESMYRDINGKKEHLFYINNFSTGTLGVEHALDSVPFKYKADASVAIITYGAVSQGAVAKLMEKKFSNITVFSRRLINLRDLVKYRMLVSKQQELFTDDGISLKEHLLAADIIINGIKQDVLSPYNFLTIEDLKTVKNKLIIDLSCDDNMGFDFSCATTLDNPIKNIEGNFYYGVDHVPTLNWREISFHLSEQLTPILNAFLLNNFDAELSSIIKNSIEIYKGKIVNQTIKKYQQKVSAEVEV